MPIETFTLDPVTVGDKTVSAVVTVETSGEPPPPPPVPVAAFVPRGHIFGLEANKNATTPADVLDIVSGEAASEDASLLLTLGTILGKSLAAPYAAGGTPEAPTGGRFDADVSDGTWHVFLIGDGATAGVGFSKSLDPTGAPNYPAGFKFRRITSRVREGGAFIPVVQVGEHHLLETPKEYAAQTNPGAGSPILLPTGIPQGVIHEAHFSLSFYNSGTTPRSLLIASPLTPNAVATGTRFSMRSMTIAGNRQGADYRELTDTSGNVMVDLEASDGGTQINRTTFGWKDARGRYL